RRTHFHLAARLLRLTEERLGRRMRRVVPSLAEISRVTETHERSEHIPVEMLTGSLEETVRAVVPHPVVHEAAAGVAPSVWRRVSWVDAHIDDLEIQRVVADDSGVAGGRFFTTGA